MKVFRPSLTCAQKNLESCGGRRSQFNHICTQEYCPSTFVLAIQVGVNQLRRRKGTVLCPAGFFQNAHLDHDEVVPDGRFSFFNIIMFSYYYSIL